MQRRFDRYTCVRERREKGRIGFKSLLSEEYSNQNKEIAHRKNLSAVSSIGSLSLYRTKHMEELI